MATNTTVNPKQHAHELIDRIPSDEIPTAVRFLEFMLLDPVVRTAAMAPLDDEPVTAEDARRIEEGQVWFAQGKGIPMEEVLGEFGVTTADFPLRSK